MLAYFSKYSQYNLFDKFSIIVTSLLTFINGVYFMKEIVVNYAKIKYGLEDKN